MSDIPNSNYYPALTGIRAIAAWMVFVHHFIPVSSNENLFLYNLLYNFHIGVSIFFVLSGFLIYHRYQSTIKEKGWLGRYFLNRFARIFPLLILLTSITYIFSDAGDVGDFLLNITLLNGYSDATKFMGIAQAWTLTVEETFYVLAPLIFLIRSKWLLWIIPVIALALGLILYGSSDFMFTYTFFGRATEFCAGIFLAMIFNKGIQPGRKYTSTGIVLIITVMIGMALLPRGGQIALNNFLLPFCVATLFFGLLKERSWISGILSGRFFEILGKSSYAFYLIHIGIIQKFLMAEINANPIVLFLILNVLAIGLYYFFERPIQRLLSRLY